MRPALDWRTLLMGLPTRRFTPEELARAQAAPLNASLRLVALLNGLPMVAALLWVQGPLNPWPFSAAVLAFAALLFSAMAALQHWVATQDARAAPLLDALTAYLRATLPLFERERLTLAQELEAVRRYLEVMQARLGARLAFDVDAPPALAGQHLPPGVLLTLVENAIEHGIQTQLGGGRVRLTLWRDGAQVHACVADDGPGAPPALLGEGQTAATGLGLANTRARLAAVGGRLTLTNPPAGGCAATASWPYEESPS